MRFSPQFLDELRARLPVSEVVGKRVKLRNAVLFRQRPEGDVV
jgi:DNA primase